MITLVFVRSACFVLCSGSFTNNTFYDQFLTELRAIELLSVQTGRPPRHIFVSLALCSLLPITRGLCGGNADLTIYLTVD